MVRICGLFVVAAIFAVSTVQAAKDGYGSQLAVECHAGQLLGAVNGDSGIVGLCVKSFVCSKHQLECTPTACGSGEEPFIFLRGSKEVGRGDNVGKELKPSCCKIKQYAGNDRLYEFKSYYTVFDGNDGSNSARPADAFNIQAVGGVLHSGEYIKGIQKVTGGYVVTTGYIQCDKTTTERPHTPPTDIVRNQDPPSAPKDGGKKGEGSGSGVGCFSGDQLVETPIGPIRVDKLKIGDQVLSSSEPFGRNTYSTVTYFIHREPETSAKFLTLTTASDQSVRMTPNHLIPVVPCDYTGQLFSYAELKNYYVPASKVKLGSCVLDASGVSPVVSISESQADGIYSPVTASGSILVNGVLCSVHVEAGEQSHSIQNFLFRTLYFAKNLVGLDWMSFSQFEELPRFVQVLITASSAI